MCVDEERSAFTKAGQYLANPQYSGRRSAWGGLDPIGTTGEQTMQIHFIPYDQTFVDALRAGGTDAYGLKAEHTV